MAGLKAADCRTALVSLLRSIDKAGKVYPQRKRMRDETELRKVSGSTKTGEITVRVWMVSPALSNTMLVERNPGHQGIGRQSPSSNDYVTLQWRIEGYLSVQDERDSEQEAMDQAERMVEVINSYGVIPDLPGASMQLAAVMNEFKYAQLAGTHLCHYIVIETGFRGRLRP